MLRTYCAHTSPARFFENEIGLKFKQIGVLNKVYIIQLICCSVLKTFILMFFYSKFGLILYLRFIEYQKVYIDKTE